MNKNSIDERVYNAILLLETNKKKSIRQIAKILGKDKSLRTIQLSIKRLIEEWKVFRNNENKQLEVNYKV